MTQYQRLFEMGGVDLTMATQELDAIARKAIDRKTGARGLRSIMEAILVLPARAMHDVRARLKCCGCSLLEARSAQL